MPLNNLFNFYGKLDEAEKELFKIFISIVIMTIIGIIADIYYN